MRIYRGTPHRYGAALWARRDWKRRPASFIVHWKRRKFFIADNVLFAATENVALCCKCHVQRQYGLSKGRHCFRGIPMHHITSRKCNSGLSRRFSLCFTSANNDQIPHLAKTAHAASTDLPRYYRPISRLFGRNLRMLRPWDKFSAFHK